MTQTQTAAVEIVRRPDASLIEQLDAFLASSPDPRAGGEHDPRWLLALERGLRHRPFALGARRDGAIAGYLPLALVASRLFGRFLVSLPYINHAGLVAADAGIAEALVTRAAALADERDVQYLELRHTEPLEHDQLGPKRDDKMLMVMELPSDAEAMWSGFNAKVRNQVRKGDKCGLSLRWGGEDVLEGFYNVFAENMRDLGTPVYPRRLFASVLEAFGDRAELAVVEHEGQAIAGALLMHHPAMGPNPATTCVPSASSLRAFNSTNANMWMYHKLLERAIARGSGWFDFGRSSEDAGTYKFKKQWGAEPRPTVWQYYLRRGDIAAVRPDSPKYRRRIETWRKLPVWLTRLIGPAIVRGIP